MFMSWCHKQKENHKKIDQTKKVIPTKTQRNSNKLEPHGYIKNVAQPRVPDCIPLQKENPTMIPAENTCA